MFSFGYENDDIVLLICFVILGFNRTPKSRLGIFSDKAKTRCI
jgi:hypothetical protein